MELKKIEIFIISILLISGCTTYPEMTYDKRTDKNINEIFNMYSHEFKNAYNNTLLYNPSLEGKIIIEVTINGSGSVINNKINNSTLNNNQLLIEIDEIVSGMLFGKTTTNKTITVLYPIEFYPR